MRRLSTAAAVLAALAIAAPAAGAASITKTAGAVTATLSWQKAGKDAYGVNHPRLVVARAGTTVFDREITDICPVGCILVTDNPEFIDYSVLKVSDLDGDGEPEVIVDPFSGGAHCCIDMRIYNYRADASTYARSATWHWLDADYKLVDLDGDKVPEISGFDARLQVATPYVFSVFPPQILSYRQDVETGKPGLMDVTRNFPDIVGAHAAKQLGHIRKAHHDSQYSHEGEVAAYVADEYLLGKGSVAKAELSRDRRKRLTRKGFATELLKSLKRLGYR